METLESIRLYAIEKHNLWLGIAYDDVVLKNINKTQQEALMLANYYEGMVDGIFSAIKINNSNKGE